MMVIELPPTGELDPARLSAEAAEAAQALGSDDNVAGTLRSGSRFDAEVVRLDYPSIADAYRLAASQAAGGPRRGAPAGTEEALASIRELIAENDHLEAYRTGAVLVRAPVLAEKLSLLKRLHALEGELPAPLYEYGRALYSELMERARRELPAGEYERFYKLF